MAGCCGDGNQALVAMKCSVCELAQEMVHIITNKRKYAVQHNTVMSCHMVLHVLVRLKHDQVLRFRTV